MSANRFAGPPALDRDSGRALWEGIRGQTFPKDSTVAIDLAGTTAMDSLGGAWLVKIAEHLDRQGSRLSLEGHSGKVAEMVGMVEPALQPRHRAGESRVGFFESLGGHAIEWAAEFRVFMELCVDALYWTVLAPFEGRGFRWGILFDEMYEMGVRAITIVCMMNFLLGLIVAMLMAKQAESYGITIFVADIIMIGFARELGAIMTAVVVSARTGAAIAAEISTMQVQEEIDALRGMGLNVNQFLVAPKVLSLLIVLPCLVTLGMISGIAGGSVWGIYVLDFQPQIWFDQTRNSARLDDLFQGFSKTLFFSVAIVLIGCHNGFRVQGGSRGVGLMTTRAVVMDIFMLITVDIVFAAIFYYV
jgi:phospholipid/cholesterol/gamma-HCH transport system permease protein